jgi:hypothetical protein
MTVKPKEENMAAKFAGLLQFVSLIIMLSILFPCFTAAQDTVKPLPDDEFEKILSSGDTLQWLRIKVLTIDQAKTIVKSGGLIDSIDSRDTILKIKKGKMWLNGLKKISENQAKILSKFKGAAVHLSGLDSLTDNQMKALCKFEAQDIKNQRRNLSKDLKQYGIIMKAKMRVFLDGLEHISDKQAKYLSKMKTTEIHLSGLTSLTDGQAKALAKAEAKYVYLDGITSLSAEQLQSLAKSKARFSFNSLDSSSLALFSQEGGNLIKPQN